MSVWLNILLILAGGPGLFEMLALLGRDRVCQRMDRAIAERATLGPAETES